MKLGVFGGTFDPIHLAHLIVAERLLETVPLDRVLFVPAHTPPHKGAPAADPAQRLELVRLATASNPRFEVGDLEVARGGRSFAVDTLRELSRRCPDDELHFITGMDSFAEIGTWREAASLFLLASFVVMARPGHPADDPLACLPAGLAGRPAGEPDPLLRRFAVEGGRSLLVAVVPQVDISSSDIRRRIRAGLSIRYLVPDAVAERILAAGIYRDSGA